MIQVFLGICIGIFSGCASKRPLQPIQHPSAFVNDWRSFQSDPDYRMRILVNQLLLQHSDAEIHHQIVQQAWQDESDFVRQKLREELRRNEDIAALRMGWKANLNDSEKCQLALDIAELTTDKSIGLWPVHSTGTLENQFICATAASHILGIHSQLDALLRDGQYPLSLNIVRVLRDFTTLETIKGLHEGLEYAEPGMRSSLSAVLAIQDPQYLQQIPKTMSEFSMLECLDMVDAVWHHSADSSLDLLVMLQKQDGLCGQWADVVMVSKGQKNLAFLQQYLKKESNPVLVIGALDILAEYPFESIKQQSKYKQKILQLLYFEERPEVQLQCLQTLHALGMEDVLEDVLQWRKSPEFQEQSSSKYLTVWIDIITTVYQQNSLQ